jgi:hypothetical protein
MLIRKSKRNERQVIIDNAMKQADMRAMVYWTKHRNKHVLDH